MMKKLITFLLLVAIIFLFFMHDIGGLKVRRAKLRKGEKIEATMIVFDWNKLSQWWDEKRKSVFKRKKELQKPRKDLEKSL